MQVVIPFDDEDEAVAIANGTAYGLVAGGLDPRRRRGRCAWRGALRAGQVFLNNYGAGGGVELPFGGVGRSGHGREKGFEALYGFTRLKTVAARHGVRGMRLEGKTALVTGGASGFGAGIARKFAGGGRARDDRRHRRRGRRGDGGRARRRRR